MIHAFKRDSKRFLPGQFCQSGWFLWRGCQIQVEINLLARMLVLLLQDRMRVYWHSHHIYRLYPKVTFSISNVSILSPNITCATIWKVYESPRPRSALSILWVRDNKTSYSPELRSSTSHFMMLSGPGLTATTSHLITLQDVSSLVCFWAIKSASVALMVKAESTYFRGMPGGNV